MSVLQALKRKYRNNYKFYFAVAPIFGLPRNVRMGMARLLHGIDGNMVTFSSFDGRSYDDNPRCVSEALHALRPETDIVWLFKDVQAARARYALPEYVRALDAASAEGLNALARCRVAVDNFNKRFYLKFPGRGQFYVQTWHGDRPFKKIGYDDPERHPRMLEDRCSLVLAGSDFGERILRGALRYGGEVQKLGCPRNDVLVRNDPRQRAEIRARLGLSEGERALLYAPTFRDTTLITREKQRVPLDLERALGRLERATGARWKCLVRAHYLSMGLAGNLDSPRMIPASDYPDMAELLLAADALLTDYSSCASDFVLMRRPIYLYQDDVEEYASRNRALYYPMERYDYWIAHTPEELDALIDQTTPERAAENCDRIMAFYGMAETGRATQAAAEYIVSKLR